MTALAFQSSKNSDRTSHSSVMMANRQSCKIWEH